jgi:hypothetical protein
MLEPRPSDCCAKIVAERDQAMMKLNQAIAERDQAIAERDEANAERDFILDFLQELGEAFGACQRIDYRSAARGVWIRALYPSPAAAAEVTLQITRLRAMVGMTHPPWRASAFESFQATAQQRM